MTLNPEPMTPFANAEPRPVEQMPTWPWQRWLRGGRQLWARDDWALFVGGDWADQLFETPATDDYHQKQGRNTGRFVFTHGSRALKVYLKRHLALPRWRGWLAALWPSGQWSPALQEWDRLRWAAHQGLRVPTVVAAGEFLDAGGRFRSFLALEELPNMVALHQAIPLAQASKSGPEFTAWKAGLIVELARIARTFHDQCRYHKDLYLCHFFVDRQDLTDTPSDWRGRVAIIDLQRLTKHPVTWPWWIVKDLGQLLYSSRQHGITVWDRMRFWRQYRKGAAFPRLHGLLAWAVRLKGERYRDHNQKLAASHRLLEEANPLAAKSGRKCA